MTASRFGAKDTQTEKVNNRAEEIRLSYKNVKDNIAKAAAKAGRSSDEIKLIAVSKNFPLPDIKIVLQLGQEDLGENRVQELVPKMDYFNRRGIECKWHMIGTLQRNKVRKIIGQVEMIHSVDSVPLIKEIEKRSAKIDCVTDILLQVNISGEESKHGFTSQDIEPILKKREEFPHVHFRGLMTMAPHYDDPEKTRPIFVKMKELQEELSHKLSMPDFDQLSMGMTNDYIQAIEEGSTMIRVGSAIFGSRYN